MKINNNFNLKQSPLEYASELGSEYIAKQSLEHKREFAQYFTPPSIAHFMASLSDIKKDKIKIVDAGAGVGILSCAVLEKLAKENKGNKDINIELVAYEIDNAVLPYLEKTLNYTKEWLEKHNINLHFKIKNEDFILANAVYSNGMPDLFTEYQPEEKCDLVISNPPYFKLSKSDPRSKVLSNVIHGQPNIYALFMAIGASIIKDNGELIFITPRSYTAGPYFRLFREKFFSIVKPINIHIFGSRDKAFNKDDVLQENIILKAVKANIKEDDKVLISYSHGADDIKNPRERWVPLSEVIDLNTENKVVRIPIDKDDDFTIRVVHSWRGSLADYQMNISTGPVVPFRAREHLLDHGNGITVPLIWLTNVRVMRVDWPTNKKKPQYIKNTENSRRLLLKNKNYVLLRRFSAKEEKQRLVAAPYIAEMQSTELIGIENHLNYLYKINGELTKEECFGLAVLLNSSLMDKYFRTFNGNTQVSATELRDMPLPPIEKIKELGKQIIKYNLSLEDIEVNMMRLIN